jgi:quinol monooxygenase YgiN
MENLEVIARLEIRPHELATFERHVAEILDVTRDQDPHTLRCDWFINEDGTKCEVHELFPNEQWLIEHKTNTLKPTVGLFRDCVLSHHATLYGDVSDDFVSLVAERMGPPTVFTYMQGLGPPRLAEREGERRLHVIAHLNVRPGQLEGFKTSVAEILRLTRERDTQTVRYVWFINGTRTECEVHETYVGEAGLIEHNRHVVEARDALFTHHADGHRTSVYGEISQQLRDLFEEHAGGVSEFAFVQGLQERLSVA